LGRAERRRALTGLDYAVSFLRPLGADDLPAAGGPRLVQRWGAGYDTIDTAALADRGIGLLRTAGANAGFVAELALTLTLCALREVPRADRALRQGVWNGERHYASSASLGGKTVGLVGLGSIAQRFAALLAPFGCEILFHARTPRTYAGARQTDLDDLLARSDVVSLHVPLTGETRGLIGADALARMKPTAVLVNTARGAVVDEAALAAALRSGAIAAAGIDVFAIEPIQPGNPLLGLENVVLTPHLGGKVRENVTGIIRHIVRNLRADARGEALLAADIVVAPPSRPAEGGLTT
jgi:D-3-phosphoglycerate dehydrogenase